MDIIEAIEWLRRYDYSYCAKGYKEAIDMAILALQEQERLTHQYRVPSKEEWMETYCTPKQLAGYQQKKNN